MVKATYVDKNGVKKGAWTEEEDNKLRAYVLRYGHWNWRLLPKFAGLQRCGKSCRLRWMNYLKPGVKRGNYSQEERDLIAKLHGELGKKWSAIAAKLPGRTDNDIKNYWHGHLKKPEKRTSSSAQQAEIFPEKQWSVVIHNQNLEEAFADSNASSVSPKIHSGEVVNSESSSDTSCHTFVSESSSSVSGNIDWDLDSSSADKKCSEKLPDFSPLSIDSGATDESSIFPDLISGFHESFWTQPFMVDTCSYNHDYSFCVLDEAGLFSPELSYCDENAINMF